MPDLGTTFGTQSSSGTVTDAAVNAIMFPAVDNALLESVSIYTGTAGAVRIGVYQGGTSDTDPDGATLIGETGNQTIVSTGQYTELLITGSPALVASTRTYIICRGRGMSRIDTGSPNVGDTIARSVITGLTGGSDEAIAMPATMDNTGITFSDSGSRAYMMYLTYRVDTGERYHVYFSE
jgi:hypothetical protein